jgi:CNH domain
LFTFKNIIAIATTKGFEVLSLDTKDEPQTIPDLSDPKMQYMRARLEGTKALGMFRISANEFLLCYDGINLNK